MKLRIASIFLAAMFMLAACGGSGSSTGSDTANNTDTISSIEPMDSDSEGDAVPVDDENATDSDGEGEGNTDSDGDNVPDYLDAISAPHILALNNISETLSISIPGIQLALGALALAQGDHDASIPEAFMVSQGVARDIGYDYPFDLADYVASGMQSGYSYPIVHSLGDKVIPEGAVYRNYLGENLGWQDFVENATNEVYSTFAEQGDCPAANAEKYSEGLTAGHNCVFLLIEDGGPNDADGMANGTLVDLGGIAIKYIGVPSANSRIVLDESTPVANCTDTTTITVWAYDEQQLPLTNMLVTATTDIQYVTVSRFVDQGDGSYIATMTAGTYSGIGQVQVEIDNGDGAVALETVIYSFLQDHGSCDSNTDDSDTTDGDSNTGDDGGDGGTDGDGDGGDGDSSEGDNNFNDRWDSGLWGKAKWQ